MPQPNEDHLGARRFVAAPHQPWVVDTNPVARDFEMVLQAWDAQRQALTLSFRTHERHVQGNGAVHGGIVTTLLDFALVFPVLALLEPPRVAVTVSLHVHFERAVLPGELQAVARIDRLGGRIAFASAELMRRGQDDVLARATATMAIV
jgi:uncharacterized protein (TIGR00369 family)